MRNGFRFFLGLHQPADAKHFERCCISVRRLLKRQKPLGCSELLIDSGAFTELNMHGHYRYPVSEYAGVLRLIQGRAIAPIVAVVTQDFMCEPFILAKTGMTVQEHQARTIGRYDELMAELAGSGLYVMPVLQGFDPADYVRHVEAYGDRLAPGAWVGVGSVCKRNGRPDEALHVLTMIKAVRADLELHGFGLKITALAHGGILEQLSTSDSMAWSWHAYKHGRNGNDWREADRFRLRVEALANREHEPWQMALMLDVPRRPGLTDIKATGIESCQVT